MMHGVRQIVRFNWPFYLASAVLVAGAATATRQLPVPGTLRGVVWIGLAAAAFWIVASLLASWVVYDRSRLMEWSWVVDVLRNPPAAWINVHCGLDESTAALRRLMPATDGRSIDIFDPGVMTEPSIRRARALVRPALEPEAADFRRLALTDASVDAALLLMSAHELRTPEARAALFGELVRVLRPDGLIVVAEHLRNWANFLVFGPGFLHFHSRRTWRRCFTQARLALGSEFSITPFVRVFVLRRIP